MNKNEAFILWFDQIGIEDIPLVGGKNASLGEMYVNLSQRGVRVPNGFAVTAKFYFYLLESNNARKKVKEILSGLDTSNIKNLQTRGKKVRELIKTLEFPEDLKSQIIEAYTHLCNAYNSPNVDVAVRSSATAEDLPDASFAGQQETYLNIKGGKQLLSACRDCFASLFTDRAISYREDKGFDHFAVGLSIAVQKMVRSDKSSSGVMFTLDTESGFRDVVFLTGAWGLGENIVQGAVNPDEFYIHKPTMKQGFKPIIAKKKGAKKIMMVYDAKKNVKNIQVPENKRKSFILNDDEIMTLAHWGCIIEDYYTHKRKKDTPMDIEWAKDGISGELFIVQARPETIHSQKDYSKSVRYKLNNKSQEIARGKAVGSMIGAGKVNIIQSASDIHKFNKEEVLVTDMTDPDWEPIMKIASAIVTNRGGRTCFTGDTVILTNKGFMTMAEVYKDFETLYVPSLNKHTMKAEWKKIKASMKRKGDIISINVSQSGRMKNNTLQLTRDHKILTFENRELISKEIQEVLSSKQMILLAQKIPQLSEASEKENKLAYLLGAISTDGSVYLKGNHGEVQLIQKPAPEKKEFIEQFCQYFEDIYSKRPSVSVKKETDGFIRGKKVVGSANAYRVYSKQIAEQVVLEKQKLVETMLSADESVILNFLGGVIDGDGSYNKMANRINIYCSNEQLLQAIVVSCLRLEILPQITNNRNIFNVQIVEQVDKILKYTKRVKGECKRSTQGTRFFSARQVLKGLGKKVNYKGKIKPYINNNLLIDAKKLKSYVFPLCSEKEKARLQKIIESDTRMQRASLNSELGIQDVYNIEVEDNHNYIVFTNRYSPILVNNCHAAIVSRELGIPCVVGTEEGTKKLKKGQEVTVDCTEGEEGIVWEGILDFKREEIDLGKIPETKTKVMINLGDPEKAFVYGQLPHHGVGLAREEFIISSHIQTHPLALLRYNSLKDKKAKKQISELTFGYKDKSQYFVDKLSQGIGMIAAGFYPHPVIVRMSDFKTNEYANLLGGKEFEPEEENPMIGWRGASRYYDDNYKDAFALECKAFKKVREEFGLKNVKAMIPFCRTVDEARKVIGEMAKNDLRQGHNGLEIIGMCEIPSNVILADEFLDVFDGFSIGSNDLTQLTLGMDRDSSIIAHISNEKDPAVISLIEKVIKKAVEKGKYIGICGQAPSDFPFKEFGEKLVDAGISSISLNPDTVVDMIFKIAEKEKK